MFQSKYGSTGIVDKPFRPGKQEVRGCSTWRGGRCRCMAWPGQCVFGGLLSQWHGQRQVRGVLAEGQLLAAATCTTNQASRAQPRTPERTARPLPLRPGCAVCLCIPVQRAGAVLPEPGVQHQRAGAQVREGCCAALRRAVACMRHACPSRCCATRHACVAHRWACSLHARQHYPSSAMPHRDGRCACAHACQSLLHNLLWVCYSRALQAG